MVLWAGEWYLESKFRSVVLSATVKDDFSVPMPVPVLFNLIARLSPVSFVAECCEC